MVQRLGIAGRGAGMKHMEHGLGVVLKDTFVWASKEGFESEQGLVCTEEKPDFAKEHWDRLCGREYAKTSFHLHKNYMWAFFFRSKHENFSSLYVN